MSDERFTRIEIKLDSLLEKSIKQEGKLENIDLQVTDIRARTIVHDNYTNDVAKRVGDIENLALIPQKIFTFTWKASLFVGVIVSVIVYFRR